MDCSSAWVCRCSPNQLAVSLKSGLVDREVFSTALMMPSPPSRSSGSSDLWANYVGPAMTAAGVAHAGGSASAAHAGGCASAAWGSTSSAASGVAQGCASQGQGLAGSGLSWNQGFLGGDFNHLDADAILSQVCEYVAPHLRHGHYGPQGIFMPWKEPEHCTFRNSSCISMVAKTVKGVLCHRCGAYRHGVFPTGSCFWCTLTECGNDPDAARTLSNSLCNCAASRKCIFLDARAQGREIMS